MRLKTLIETIKNLAIRFPNVNSVYDGDVYQLNELMDVEYAAVVVTEQRHRIINKQYEEFGFNLFYVDRETSSNSNVVDIHSTANEVIRGIIDALCENPYITQIGQYEITPFRERFSSSCAGAYCYVTLRVDNNLDCEGGGFDTGYTKEEIEEILEGKQDKLICGENLKTINGECLLGSGNIDIQGGGVTQEYVDDGDAETLEEAKEYADSLLGGDKKNAYAALRDVNDRLFEAWYDKLDYDGAVKYFNDKYINYGACTSIVDGSKLGRNYDWYYDDMAEFVVHTPSMNGRYATIGVCGNIPEFTNDIVKSREYSEVYKYLPFYCVDGMNEKGLRISVNVVPNDRGETRQNVEGRRTLCSALIPRYILDHHTSALEACEDIKNNFNIYMKEGREVHFLITDDDGETYCLEFIENETVITILEDYPFITNFHLDGVEINEGVLDWSTVEDYGMGLERYQYLLGNYNEKSLEELLDDLQYDNAYTRGIDDEDFWKTEYTTTEYGLDITIHTPTSDTHLRNFVAAAQNLYNNRERGNGTWLTEHRSVYDASDLTLTIQNQLGVDGYGEEYEFLLYDNNYYTKEQVNNLLGLKTDKSPIDNMRYVQKNGQWVESNEIQAHINYNTPEKLSFNLTGSNGTLVASVYHPDGHKVNTIWISKNGIQIESLKNDELTQQTGDIELLADGGVYLKGHKKVASEEYVNDKLDDYYNIQHIDGFNDHIYSEIASGDARTLTSAKTYTDEAVAGKQDILDSYLSEAYTENSGNTLVIVDGEGAELRFTPNSGGQSGVTQAYVDSQDSATLNSANTYTNQSVSGKANSSDVYTKSETDSKVAQSLTEAKEYASGYTYSKSQSDAKYALIGASYTKSEEDDLLDDKADKADVYTKTEADGLFAPKVSTNDRLTAIEATLEGLDEELTNINSNF